MEATGKNTYVILYADGTKDEVTADDITHDSNYIYLKVKKTSEYPVVVILPSDKIKSVINKENLKEDTSK